MPPSDDFTGREGAQRLHRLTAIAIATSTQHRRPDSAYRSRLRCGDARSAAAEAEHPAGSCGHRAVVGRRNPVGIGTCAAPIDDDEITTVDGIAVTSLERTSVDVACAGTFAQPSPPSTRRSGVVVTPALMAEILARRRRVGGRRAARAHCRWPTGIRGVGESWSRAQMIEAGLPVPRLQRPIICRSGTPPPTSTGTKKLVRRVRRKSQVREVFHRRERHRCRHRERSRGRIRAHGPMVIRWTWSTLESGSVPHPLSRFGLITPRRNFRPALVSISDKRDEVCCAKNTIATGGNSVAPAVWG